MKTTFLARMYGVPVPVCMLPLVLSIILLSAVPFSYADDDVSLSIDVPSVMIAGETYLGTISSEKSGLVLLSSSNSAIAKTIPSAYVDSFGHVTFEITPQDKGPVVINAHMGIFHVEAKSEVFFPTVSRNSLDLILLSNSTTIPKTTGYVYLLESNLPVVASEDVEILVSSVGSIHHKESYLLRQGQTGISFDMELDGDAEITVSAVGYLPDTESISLVPQNVNVTLEVAPLIVAPNSIGYAVISLTENEEHFVPSRSYPVTIRSSDPSIISVNPGSSVTNLDDSKNVYFDSDGLAMVKLYSGNPGSVEISASVAGMGVDSITVHVTNNPNSSDPPFVACENTPNRILTWMLPTLNSGQGYLFAATYAVGCSGSEISNAITDEILYQDDPHTVSLYIDDANNAYISTDKATSDADSSGAKQMMSPLIHSSYSLSLTSNGAKHDSSINLAVDGFPSNVGWVNINAPTGQYSVSLTSSDSESSVKDMQFGKSSFQSYDLQIIPFPVLVGYEQDVFAAVVKNSQGSIVNPYSFGNELSLTVTSVGFSADNDVIHWPAGGTVSVVSGTVISGGEIAASLSGIGSDVGMLYLSNTLSDSQSILVDAPDSIYSTEEFAAYGFVLDGDGIPIHRMPLDATGSCVTSNVPYLYRCDGIGSLVHSSSAGISEIHIEPQLKPFDSPALDLPDVLHVDSIYPVVISGISDTAKIVLETDVFTYDDDGVIYFAPKKTGEFDMLISISDTGFHSASLEHTVSITDDVQFDVVSTDGTRTVGIPLKYWTDNTNGDYVGNSTSQQSSVNTPSSFTAPRGTITFELEDIVQSDTQNLKLVQVVIDGLPATENPFSLSTNNRDLYSSVVKINATYEPQIILTLNDPFNPQKISFSVGDTVDVPAPPSQPKYAGLVYDKFVGWNADDFSSKPQINYSDDGSASFIITQHLTLDASYDDDYIFAAIIAGVAIVFVLASVTKRDHKFLLVVALDKLRSLKKDEEFEDEADDEVDDDSEELPDSLLDDDAKDELDETSEDESEEDSEGTEQSIKERLGSFLKMKR